jgi:ABC-2 type transport system permease protein
VTTLTGLWPLVRFTLRRDRVRLAVWILGIAVTTVISAASLLDVYPDQAAIDSYVRLFGDNPALVAFAGPGYGFDDPNIGVVLVNETQLYGMVATALMSIFLLNRSTRAEEDSERAELVLANVVGRHAPTAAATAVVALANVVIAVLCLLGFVALDYPVPGSVALAGSQLVVGIMFAGVTAVMAQLFSSGRSVLGMSSVVLAVAFVVRAIGDNHDRELWPMSPMGWAQGVRAYAGERWWTLALCAALAVALVTASFWLSTRRDLGTGLLPQKPGPPAAAGWVTRPLGLAFRLQRGSLIGWTIGLFLIGGVYGSIADDIDEMIEDNPQFAEVFLRLGGASLTDTFFATSMTMLALIASGFAISSALTLRSEEGAGRADSVLAGPVSRDRWALSHLVIAVAGTVLTVGAAGLGVGVGYAAVIGDLSQIPRLTGVALVTVPGVLVLVGATTALFGLAPRAALASWGVLAVMAVIGFFAALLQLPDWTLLVSPFEHLPAVPAEDLRLAPILLLTVLAAALVAGGLWGLRHRDAGAH